MYHQVLPKSDPAFNKHIAVSPEILREHVTTLLQEGWKIMTLEDYFAHPVGSRPAKVAMLTFDDVCSSFKDHGAPVLKELGVRANIYPIKNMTFGDPFHNLKNDGIRGLTEAELRELYDDGYELGSHGLSHQSYHKMKFIEAKYEIIESKRWLESITKKEVQTICYPIGGINKDIVEVAKEAGYKIGITTFKGSLQLKDDIMVLRRVDIKHFIVGDKFKKAIGPFYGLRRFLTRPIRKKYQVSHRHPDLIAKN